MRRLSISTRRLCSFYLATLLSLSCSQAPPDPTAANTNSARPVRSATLPDNLDRIERFFQRMGAPGPVDWLASNTEPGQTFNQYLDADPTRPSPDRQKIYILPLGRFTKDQHRVIDAASNYLEVFYDLPVNKMRARALPRPQRANDRRINRVTGVQQVRTGYILADILRPMVPADAAGLIAFTNEDLFPEQTMNFVFGQASLDDRVGVWSLYRLDDRASPETFLLRTLKIAAHEAGHMFGMRHCTKYECIMSGTNHLGETDRRPADACPECTAKICWMSEIAPRDRYRRLATFARRQGLTSEATSFEEKRAALTAR